MSTLFFLNPRLTLLMIGLIVVAGLSSFAVLPQMEDPLLTPRAALVLTSLAGADAEQVESLVTDRIENELREIDEIRELRSESRASMSTITVELRDDVDAAAAPAVWSRIRDRLANAEPFLPTNASKPRFEELEVTAYTRLVALVWDDIPFGAGRESDGALYSQVHDMQYWGVLRRVAEDLRDRLLAVPGTKDVEILGNPREEILVEILPEVLSSMGLTAGQLSQMISGSDARISAGVLRGDSADLQLEISGELDSVNRITEIPIRTTADGRSVTLGDVARVRRSIADPPDNLAIVDGRPAIVLACLVRPNQRVDRWSAASEKVTQRFAEQLSGSIRLHEIFNQNVYVQQRLGSLMWNLLIGVTSVIGVIWWLMGWRSALIVGAALPLSSLMVLSAMRALGIPVHQMSSTGLIIALGLLIDNAIVMVDEIQQRRRFGCSAVDAIRRTVHSLAVPLSGSTLTTALAFGPIALMPGPAGEFVGSIAVNVILAVFSSLLLSLTVVPALTGFFGATADSAGAVASRWYRDGWSSAHLTAVYTRLLASLFRHPWVGIVGGMMLPIAGFVQARNLPEQFFPPADRDQISIEMELSPQASLNETLLTAQQMRQMLLRESAVTEVSWFVGRSAPPFYYNQIPSTRGVHRYAQALVRLNTSSKTSEVINPIQKKLDATFPAVRTLVRQLEQGPPFMAPIEVRVTGPDLDELRVIAEQLRSILVGVPSITHVRTESSELLPGLTLNVDESAARMVNMDHQELSLQMAAVLEGSIGGLVLEGTEELPLRVRVGGDGRNRLGAVESLTVLPGSAAIGPSASGNGKLPFGNAAGFMGIPLSALGTMQLRQEVTSVSRLNHRRINEVQGFIQAGVLPVTVLNEFQHRLHRAQLQLPDGYAIEFGGEAAERNDAVGNLLASVGVLAMLMVAALVLALGSFRMAAVIGMIAVLSVGLGLGSLWLWGWPFGFMAIIGVMGLIGVAINDSIVVLASIKEDAAARSGNPDAVGRVVLHTTRHVVATTLTTIAGFLPLWLGGGSFWPPLAVAIAGGVAGATALALIFVPSVYLILTRFQRGVLGVPLLDNESTAVGREVAVPV